MDFYYKVDVSGRHGYSFMVKTDGELPDDTIIYLCEGRGLFQDAEDAEYATVDDLVTDREIEIFRNCTYEI